MLALPSSLITIVAYTEERAEHNASALLDFPDSTGSSCYLPRAAAAPPQQRSNGYCGAASDKRLLVRAQYRPAIMGGTWRLVKLLNRSRPLSILPSPSQRRSRDVHEVEECRCTGRTSNHTAKAARAEAATSLATPHEEPQPPPTLPPATPPCLCHHGSDVVCGYRVYSGVAATRWPRNDEREIDRPLAPDGRRSYVSTYVPPPRSGVG